MENKQAEEHKPSRKKTPTFQLELPLVVEAGQAARVGAHLEVGRQFYNAVLSAGQQRLRRMRADPAWQATRAIPRTQPQERRAALAAFRGAHGFSEYPFSQPPPKPPLPPPPQPPSSPPAPPPAPPPH